MMAKALKILAAGVLAGVILVSLGASPAMALVDSVHVTDLTVAHSDQDTVWLYFENTVSIKGVAFPLALREVTAGSFMTELTMLTKISGSRIENAMTEITAFNQYSVENGNCKNSQPGGFAYGEDTVDYVSPDAIMFAKQKLFSPSVAAGSDFAGTGTGIPAFGLVMTVTDVPGTFEIDTTCTSPANHLVFVTDANAEIVPGFHKGTVTITGNAVHEIGAGAGVPEGYTLGQNHPNPFNASTVIEFTNQRDGNVRLDVFNILGQNVVTLLDKYMELGTYAVDWDGRDRGGNEVASGMYFYRLQAGDFRDVKKMVLLK